MREFDKTSCDVLIVGGGIGGLSCAAAIKERSPEADVLLVEKNFAGYSGKANRGGGVLQYFDLSKIDPKEFVAFHTIAIGAFFTDQELMEKYVSMNTAMLDKLSSWGVNLPREEDGSYHVMPTGPMTAMICVDLDITLKVRKTAEKLGVRFMDKTTLIELTTDGAGVTGAAVMSVLDGRYTVIAAKRVVLATGSQNYRVGSMWSSGRGDGIAAAYRAGAELRNVEFGNFAQLVKVKSHNEVVFGENFMYNARGEHITKNFRQFRETDINSNAIREWYMQMSQGNGPVHLDYGEGNAEEGSLERLWYRPYGKKFRMLNDESGAKVDTDLEVCPMFIGEQSPIRVNHNMKTTVDGLYAIGDCSYCGSGLAGAVPAPPGRNRGSGILNAVFAALMCAEEVGSADLSGAVRQPEISQAVVAMEHIDGFLNRSEGVTAKQVIGLIQQAMAPMERSVWMREDRMKEAMELVRKAKELTPQLCAGDTHGALECLEAEAMVLSAELHYTAANMRKESRGWFLREDYPEMDNENWLKWIIVKNEGGEMTLRTEALPMDKWAVKP
ncbi:MAG: FAD-binding protein [Oscillospiraceae bacterium]|nr:FAD-binding protein [Oscillospiraceae bacterium]